MTLGVVASGAPPLVPSVIAPPVPSCFLIIILPYIKKPLEGSMKANKLKPDFSSLVTAFPHNAEMTGEGGVTMKDPGQYRVMIPD